MIQYLIFGQRNAFFSEKNDTKILILSWLIYFTAEQPLDHLKDVASKRLQSHYEIRLDIFGWVINIEFWSAWVTDYKNRQLLTAEEG